MLRHFVPKRFNYLNMFQVISIFSSLPLSPSLSLSLKHYNLSGFKGDIKMDHSYKKGACEVAV